MIQPCRLGEVVLEVGVGDFKAADSVKSVVRAENRGDISHRTVACAVKRINVGQQRSFIFYGFAEDVFYFRHRFGIEFQPPFTMRHYAVLPAEIRVSSVHKQRFVRAVEGTALEVQPGSGFVGVCSTGVYGCVHHNERARGVGFQQFFSEFRQKGFLHAFGMRQGVVQRVERNPVFGQIRVDYRRRVGGKHFAHHRDIVKVFFDLSCIKLVLESEVVGIFFGRRRELPGEK